MAQVQLNEETGLFEAVVGQQDVTDASFEEGQVALDEQAAAEELPADEGGTTDVLEDQEDILDNMGTSSLESSEDSETSTEDLSSDYTVMPLAAVETDYSFTPQSWQVNLAAARRLGEHYLMYMKRSGSSRDYWLILGSDISYSNDIYTYTDCEQYFYNSYNSVVTYEVSQGSGSVNGETYLVYSDLYFDYVGTDPAQNSFVYIFFVLFLVLFGLIVLGGKRNV